MQTQTPVPSFTVPADMMQGIVSTLGGLPWQQVNGLLAPLANLCSEQQVAFSAAQQTKSDAPAA